MSTQTDREWHLPRETVNWVDELRNASTRLAGLLADPHPGLHTWVAAVAGIISGMAKSAGV